MSLSNSTDRQPVSIVGAGVVGLSTAVLLAERGYGVTIFTDRAPLETTSAVAGASVKPHMVPDDEATLAALRTSIEMFHPLVADPGSGVHWHRHVEAASTPLSPARYLDAMTDVQRIEFPDAPGGYRFARSYMTFLIDMPVYLLWLLSRFRALGGTVELLPHPLRGSRPFAALPTKTVVNCTGMGASALCCDDAMYPVRGQVVLVRPQHLDYSISADGFYIYPRSGDTVIGGTSEMFSADEDVDRSVVPILLRAARRILPDLSEADVLRSVAGVRPCRRGAVRVEAEVIGSKRVIHNYGHGGAGVTLSWGTALQAAALVAEKPAPAHVPGMSNQSRTRLSTGVPTLASNAASFLAATS